MTYASQIDNLCIYIFWDAEKALFKLWKSTGRFNLKLFALFADVEKYLSKKGRILIGYSGGLDSTVLLTLASEYFTSKKVLAVHINHGLSPNAENWQSFVVAYCKFLSVEYLLQRVEIIESANQEAIAREARVDVFVGAPVIKDYLGFHLIASSERGDFFGHSWH